ncbi:hypothetical protein [Edaphobacter albus]|uniref:hypothetical protein n=1 Tax=Edaphobacter sp. 4G125 TaxID=2763071 RepID=UPI0016473675|nr:hypothetical protein [Edaphobacter sp. 4G125]QNI35546.1 hypothetical protein H7846_10725 [Edaphobacter sp. 4G125]
MAKLTIVFAVLLILLGLIGFVSTGSAHPTALIPSGVGVVFAIFGILSNTPDPKKRMLWMHISVTVALLAFLGTLPAGIQAMRLSHGAEYAHPVAVLEKAAMSLLCLIYVLFCVRSFINARVQRS